MEVTRPTRHIAPLLLHHGHGDGEIIPARQEGPALIREVRSSLSYPPELLQLRSKGVGAPPPCGSMEHLNSGHYFF